MNYNNDYHASIADVEDIATRQKTLRAAALKTLHLLYYVQQTLGKSDWSVADDEGYDTPYNKAQMDAWIQEQPELAPYRPILHHFSIMAYARESRRIIGLHTLSARDIERNPGKPTRFENIVALGDYAVDLHGSKKPELLELDIDAVADIPQDTFGSRGTGPFAIPFECFIPQTLDGFIPAEKNISQSRLANGATRLQPSTMLMGQAAGAISALAVKHAIQPRDLDPVLVQRVLLETGDTLQITSLRDIAKSSWEWPPVQLVTVRGLMSLEDGKFHPDQPLTAAAAAQIMERAFGQKKAFSEPVTRAQIAQQWQTAMASAQVTLTGIENIPQADEPMPRIEAAHLLSLMLEQRALAHISGEARTLAWPTPLARTPIRPEDLAPQLAADLRLLIQHRVISSLDYWLTHAHSESTCDGKNVAVMLKNTAHRLRPNNAANPIQICVEEGILSTPDYWEKSAVAGRTCSGSNVQTVIRRIAQKLTTQRP